MSGAPASQAALRLPGAAAFLGLGSNLGDRLAHLGRALAELQDGSLEVIRVSSVYESAALGPVRCQPDFLNIVAQVSTILSPLALLDRCLDVEERLGRPRVRTLAKGPRLIDVDLLLYGEHVQRWGERLTLPHPELRQRAFVLLPLLELCPDLRDPVDGSALAGRAELLGAQPITRLQGW